MSWVDFFKQKIKEISPGLFPQDYKKVKIIATISTDSVVASSFLIKTFQYLNYNFSCSFEKIINTKDILEDSSELFVLINPGLSAENIEQIKQKKIIIIESESKNKIEGLIAISPQQFDQNLVVPASSLTYLLCKEFYSHVTDISYLLPLPFFETNLVIPEQLLNEAIISKKLDIKKGITLLISQTLPIHKAVANTFSPYLPQISGSEDNAINFLIESEVPVRENSKFKKVEDLNEDQTKKLVTSILLKRLGSERNPDQLLDNSFLLVSEDDTSIIKDLKSFNYLIQACLAYSKPSLALNICLMPKNKTKAYEYVNNSQIGLAKAMEFYLINKRSLTAGNEELSIIKTETVLDVKLLNMFTKIVNSSNFLPGKIIGVSTINSGGEILLQLEPSIEKYKELLPKLIEELKKLMVFSLDFSNNIPIIIVPGDQEESLMTNILKSSENIKINQHQT